MRAVLAGAFMELAASLVLVASIVPTRAADVSDLPPAPMRATSLRIYDNQPGVTTRDYWLAPWHNAHYFPRTGKRPGVGRLERLDVGRAPIPAKSFHRAWSTSSDVVNENSNEASLVGRAPQSSDRQAPRRGHPSLRRPSH